MVIYLLISTFEFASFTSLNVLDKIIQIGCFSHFILTCYIIETKNTLWWFFFFKTFENKIYYSPKIWLEFYQKVFEINPSCDLLAGAQLNLAFESVG